MRRKSEQPKQSNPDEMMRRTASDLILSTDNRTSSRSGFPQARRDNLTQPSSGFGFLDVSCLTDIKSGFHSVAVVVHCEEDYPRLRRFLPNHLGSFDPIQAGQSNIEDYDVRLQFTCFLDSLLPIGRFGDDLPFWMRRQNLANSRPPTRPIIDDENSRIGKMGHDSADSRTLHSRTAFRLPRKQLTSHAKVLTIWVFGQSNRRPSPTLPVIQYQNHDGLYCRLHGRETLSDLYPTIGHSATNLFMNLE